MKKKWKKKHTIILVIALIIIVSVAYYYINLVLNSEREPGKIQKLSETECNQMYNSIDKDLQNANYCEQDSDCTTLPLAGPYIEFGCYHYINKNVNWSDFYRRMNEYDAYCGNIIDECRKSPEPKCENKTCVESEITKIKNTSEDYYIHGAIGVGFKINVSQQDAEAVLEKYNLIFTKTDDLNLGMNFFFSTEERFAVKTGEGKEDYWISILDNETLVYRASWLPDPDKVLVD